MKICNICHKISATDMDHLDCVEKIRLVLEDENFKKNIPEKLDLDDSSINLGVEVKAILEHLKKEEKKS